MKLLHGTMQEQLKNLEDNSVDSIVCDPPYGIEFMNKGWDKGVPTSDMWEECLRVLKPGGHLLAFFGSRTYHRGAVEIEDAGFEIRDQIMWCYNSGFPKSYNLGKAYDKRMGVEREVVGYSDQPGKSGHHGGNIARGVDSTERYAAPITKGDGPLEGWGTALKPAHEPIVMARKPVSEKTVLDNWLKHGVGGINIDESRVGDEVISINELTTGASPFGDYQGGSNYQTKTVEGRWPANLISDGEVFGDNTKFYFVPKVSKKERNEGLEGKVAPTRKAAGDFRPSYDQDGSSGTAYGRWGEALNTHPTVKPIALMEYLIKLVTPAGGIVLDPFMGSGSTGCAAVKNGFDFIGVEMEEHSFEIAKARIEYWMEK